MEIIDGNPMFELYEPDYLLDPWLIAQNHQQVAINNALSVDLIGQINSESVFGGQLYNGIGGQPETHMGALYSRGGRAITLLYSTALDGAVSRIVPRFSEGEIVTIPRFWADTIVTEYGIAELAGKNNRERAESLISIAHPDFRSELRADAIKWIPG
jgi:4-hydroxybutyrate CoA-transferase